MSWCPINSCIVDSSLWDEPDYVIKVFLTMLARKDGFHIYRGNAYNLGKQSRKTESEVLDALKILAAPDKRRIEKQPFDGRRIQAVEDGWLVLNGEKYMKQMQIERKRARDARAQQAARERKKKLKESSGPLPGETAYVKGVANGYIDPQTGEPIRSST